MLNYPYSRDDQNIYCGSLRLVVEHPDEFRVLTDHSERSRVSTSCYYSTDELIERIGEEYADHEVLYDPDTRDMRYVVIVGRAGWEEGDTARATAGEWLYDGAKRSRLDAIPPDKP